MCTTTRNNSAKNAQKLGKEMQKNCTSTQKRATSTPPTPERADAPTGHGPATSSWGTGGTCGPCGPPGSGRRRRTRRRPSPVGPRQGGPEGDKEGRGPEYRASVFFSDQGTPGGFRGSKTTFYTPFWLSLRVKIFPPICAEKNRR